MFCKVYYDQVNFDLMVVQFRWNHAAESGNLKHGQNFGFTQSFVDRRRSRSSSILPGPSLAITIDRNIKNNSQTHPHSLSTMYFATIIIINPIYMCFFIHCVHALYYQCFICANFLFACTLNKTTSGRTYSFTYTSQRRSVHFLW
jgi:hypothetical protein